MQNLIKYRSVSSVLADGYLPVCELKRCSVARAKFFVSSAERWEPTHCNQTLILQPLLLAAHYWINMNLQQRQSHCVCVWVHTFGFWVGSHTQVSECGDHRPEPAQEKQKPRWKNKRNFFFPVVQNFKKNSEKAKANFIYLLQRHRGTSDSVKAAYGAWRVCTPFWKGCISLCRYSS